MPRMSFRRRIRGARITDGKRPLHVTEEDKKAPAEAKEEKKSNNRRKR